MLNLAGRDLLFAFGTGFKSPGSREFSGTGRDFRDGMAKNAEIRDGIHKIPGFPGRDGMGSGRDLTLIGT